MSNVVIIMIRTGNFWMNCTHASGEKTIYNSYVCIFEQLEKKARIKWTCRVFFLCYSPFFIGPYIYVGSRPGPNITARHGPGHGDAWCENSSSQGRKPKPTGRNICVCIYNIYVYLCTICDVQHRTNIHAEIS